jgi:hypothetical protein
MKVILSRKGFDSAAGGFPSPILPDGTLLSLPIPDNNPDARIKYSQIKTPTGKSYLDVMEELEINIDHRQTCHLDPDIYPYAYPRGPKWRGAFGQIGAAQSHLAHHHIKKNDLFLFFGYFQDTKINKANKLEFIPNTAKHIIFGYLQVDQIFKVSNQIQIGNPNTPKWLKYHPHSIPSRRKHLENTIYVAKKELTFSDEFKGFGAFKFNRQLALTKRNETRSRWKLPNFMKKLKISYHDQRNWRDDFFQSASRGQEFVIEESEEVTKWAKDLITTSTQP